MAKGPDKSGRVEPRVKISSRDLPIAGYANACSILQRGPDFELVFFETHSETILARLAVDRFPFTEHLWRNSADFYDETLLWLKERGVKAAELASNPPDVKGTRAVACNIFRIFRTNNEATVDCYYLPPGEIHEAKLLNWKTVISPRPLFQVQLGLPLLMGILAGVRERVASLTKENV